MNPSVTLSPIPRHDPTWRDVRALYLRAFPAEERAPFWLLKRRAIQSRGELLAIRNGGGFAGFAYVIGNAKAAYLFFFAIADGQRGRGYGSAVLAALKERYAGKALFLARETLDQQAQNYDQRVRRRGFYLRGGFSDLPLQISEAGVTYDVMGVGGAPTPEDYQSLMRAWAGPLLLWLAGLRMTAIPCDSPIAGKDA